MIAVLIAALSFWDNHNERREADRARLAADQRAAVAPAFVLVGTADPDGARIGLRPVHEEQPIQSQVFFFPAAVRGGPVETTGAARIEAGWFEDGLRKAASKADRDGGDLRLPVGVETTYLADGETRVDHSIYDIGYRLEHRMLRGDRVILEGLSVVRRNAPGDLKAATEQIYKTREGSKPQ